MSHEEKFDREIARALRTVAPPPELREQILKQPSAEVVPMRPVWSYGWLAAAAILVITLSCAALILQRAHRRETPLALAQFALADLGRPGHRGDPDTPSRQVLEHTDQPLTSAALPIDFARMRRDGCRSLSFGGRKVIEVCFSREGVGYHLYILRREPSDRMGWSNNPEDVASENGSAAAWLNGDYLFALATKAPAAALQKLL